MNFCIITNTTLDVYRAVKGVAKHASEKLFSESNENVNCVENLCDEHRERTPSATAATESKNIPPTQPADKAVHSHPRLELRHFNSGHPSKKTLGFYRFFFVTTKGEVVIEFPRRECCVILAIAILATRLGIPFQKLLMQDDGQIFVESYILFFGARAMATHYRDRFHKIMGIGSQEQRYFDVCKYGINKEMKKLGKAFGVNTLPFVPNLKNDFLEVPNAELILPDDFTKVFPF